MPGQGGGFRDESERMGGNHLRIWCVVGIGTGKSSRQGRQNCSEFKSVDQSGKKKRQNVGDFSGGPVVKTPHFHCRGHGFDPWLRN